MIDKKVEIVYLTNDDIKIIQGKCDSVKKQLENDLSILEPLVDIIEGWNCRRFKFDMYGFNITNGTSNLITKCKDNSVCLYTYIGFRSNVEINIIIVAGENEKSISAVVSITEMAGIKSLENGIADNVFKELFNTMVKRIKIIKERYNNSIINMNRKDYINIRNKILNKLLEIDGLYNVGDKKWIEKNCGKYNASIKLTDNDRIVMEVLVNMDFINNKELNDTKAGLKQLKDYYERIYNRLNKEQILLWLKEK